MKYRQAALTLQYYLFNKRIRKKPKMFPFWTAWFVDSTSLSILINTADYVRCSFCFEGHTILPYVQNTQQSPGFGFNMVLQFVHSYKNRHESVGIVSSFSYPHSGHLIIDFNSIIFEQVFYFSLKCMMLIIAAENLILIYFLYLCN